MSERYIERGRLNPQQFPLNCPVKLAAGALLEDTRQPRLVAQLKFIPVKTAVAAVSVTLRCQGETETDLPFRYDALSAGPGQAFGQYTAITLPAGTANFHVTVEEVTFKNGGTWSRANAEAQEQARQEAAARREEQYRQAKQEAAEKAAAMKAAAAEKLAQKKAESRKKAEEKLAAQEARISAEGTAEKQRGKGKIIAIAAVLVVAVIAGVILVPKLVHNDQPAAAEPTPEVTVEPTPAPTPKPTPTPKPMSIDLGETGDITAVYITKDDHGYYPLTPNSFSPYLPDASTTCAQMGRDLGDDILAYLKNSFSFAWIVGSGIGYGISGDGTSYPQGNGDIPETVCVLAFDAHDHGCRLTGYFIGIPEQYDEDTIRIDLTMCNYDLTPLYEQERAAFDAGKDFLYENYISPDSDFEALGAKYYVQGYYTCETGNLEDDDVQAYHIWQEATSAEHIEAFARAIPQLEDRLSRDYGRDRTMFFLLLDKKYQPIGVTWQ